MTKTPIETVFAIFESLIVELLKTNSTQEAVTHLMPMLEAFGWEWDEYVLAAQDYITNGDPWGSTQE